MSIIIKGLASLWKVVSIVPWPQQFVVVNKTFQCRNHRYIVLYLSASLNSVYFPSNVLIVHIRPAFYGNDKTNASGSLQTCYHPYKYLVIGDRSKMVINMLQICFQANFRSMILIIVTPQKRAWIPTKANHFLAITLRSLRIGGKFHL